MRWRKSASDGEGDVFLSGTRSELADFGDSGADGFASAWEASDVDRRGDSADDPFAGFEDKASQRARDLDRRSRRGLVLVVLVVVAGLGSAAVVRSGLFGEADEATTALEDGANELASIGDDRAYVEGPAEVTVPISGQIDRGYVSPSVSSDPMPSDVTSSMQIEAAFGTVFWAGRTHVVVVGRGLDLSVDCVVASLVTTDLRVIDLAAHGACTEEFAPTGDRRACVGEEVVLLEVWPYDPDSVVEQPAVEGLRVRIERLQEPSGSVVSIRGSTPLEGDLAAASTPLSGAPGTTRMFGLGDLSASCELLDRAEVAVQLL